LTNKPNSAIFALAARTLHALGKETGQFSFRTYAVWKQMLPDIFHKYYDETEVASSIDKELKANWDLTASMGEFKRLSEDDQFVYICLVHLYIELLHREDDLIAMNNTKDLFNAWMGDQPFDTSRINNQIEDWLEKKEKRAFRPVISVNVTYSLVLLDFALRVLFLILIQTDSLKIIDVSSDETKGFGMFINILGIPFAMVLLALAWRTYKKRKIDRKLQYLQLQEVKIIPRLSAWHYFSIFILAAAGITIGELHIDGLTEKNPVAFFFIMGGLFTWYWILMFFFSLPVPSSKKIYQKLHERNQIEIEEVMTSDENDIEIVNMEVRLRSLNEKMNAFVLEAALFGALAFSGFIQIIASEIFTLEAFASFNDSVIELIRGIVTLNSEGTAANFSELMHRNTLLSLLCYESLICSICFLSVISSRLRYSDLTDLLDRALEMGKNFNKKEEGLILHQQLDRDDEKVKRYTREVKNHLQQGLKDYNQIVPVLEYMRFFRTLGIGTFFIIIITGGLFISPLVSILFLIIFILSTIYFQFDAIQLAFLELKTRVQETRAKNEKLHAMVLSGFVVLALVYRSFYLPGSHFLGGLIIALLIILQLLFLIEGKRMSITSTLFSRIFRIAAFFFVFGLLLKFNHWPGASLSLIVGVFFLAFFFIFHPIRNDDKKWLVKIIGVGIALGLLGLLFKIQHYPGATLMRVVGTVGVAVGLLLSFWKKEFLRLSPFYKLSLSIAVVIGIQAWAFHGIGFHMLTKMHLNLKDANKRMKMDEAHAYFVDEMKLAIDSTSQYWWANADFVNNEKRRALFDSYLDTIKWAKTEPIYGLHYGMLLDNYEFFDRNNSSAWNYTPEQLQKLLQWNQGLIQSAVDANPEYVRAAGYTSEEYQNLLNFDRAYLLFRLSEDSLANEILLNMNSDEFYTGTMIDGEELRILKDTVQSRLNSTKLSFSDSDSLIQE
jgi:hypothetical protein